MRIYYSISFESDKKVDVLYFDAIAFTINGKRYSIDVSGEHDCHLKQDNDICTAFGRVKGDCNTITYLDNENSDYEEIEYTDLYELLKNADDNDLEFVLVGQDGEEFLNYISYKVLIELNGCTPLLLKLKRRK